MSAMLTEDLGPQGRRRVRQAQVVGGVLVVALAAFVVWRFWSAGELEWRLWEEFASVAAWQFLLEGLWNTIKAALLSMALALVIGLALALGRVARNRIVHALSVAYIEFWRGVPVIVLILFAYFGLSDFIGISPFAAVVLALTVYNSAVLAEIFRAGIKSLEGGQGEAAAAIGLTYWQGMRLVILPQALRRMTPAVVAQMATLTKDTTLGYVIGYEEFLRRFRGIAQQFPINELQAYTVAAVVYFILIYLLSRLAQRLEQQQRRRGEGGVAVEGTEDLDALREEGDEAEREEVQPAPAG